jgi:putative PIN family toxin of toxin-antitoxin system
MKVIIDTNILISAALSGRNPELIINFIIESSEHQWIASQAIFDEYLEVLNRPRIKLTNEKRQRWLNLVKNSTKLINVNIIYDFPRDQKDAKFVACVIASKADFLITGDRDFEEVNLIGDTVIISVSQFKDLFMS